jgi:catalase
VISPEDAVDSINRRFGRHAGRRALHAKGTFLRGSFTATPEAGRLTRAAHMQGEPVDVLARVSNGSGNPDDPDYAPDVRGLAVSFRPAEGSATDIVAQTAPRFPIHDPDAFIELVHATEPGPAMAWKLPAFLARHPGAVPSLPGNLAATKPPSSYASRPYYAIHAYKWVDAEGGERYVRYTWLPEREEPYLGIREARSRGRDYLQEEIAERLGKGPARLDLQLQIAAEGDDPDDPAGQWPDDRQTVIAGTLELTAIVPDAESDGIVVFDPVRVIDGIELSDDPVLQYRPKAYSVSAERRAG